MVNGLNVSRLIGLYMHAEQQFGRVIRRWEEIHEQARRAAGLVARQDLASDALRRDIRRVIEHLCDTENPLLNRMEREKLIEEILDETLGFGPLEMLLKDPTISDILVNGRTRSTSSAAASWRRPTSSSATTTTCCRSSTASSRRSAGASTKRRPMVDARLPDGSASTRSFRRWPSTAL
jgi:pilus assembly protein CpaF